MALAGCPVAVVPPAGVAGRLVRVKMQRPAGRTILTRAGRPARLVPGRRRRGGQVSSPAGYGGMGRCGPVPEPEVPRRRHDLHRPGGGPVPGWANTATALGARARQCVIVGGGWIAGAPGSGCQVSAQFRRNSVLLSALSREAGQVGEGLVDGVRDALAEQPPGRLVARGGVVADTGGVGRHSRLNHLEELPGGS